MPLLFVALSLRPSVPHTVGTGSSYAADVSNDGSIVVGYGFSAGGQEAYIWDSANGIRSLKEVLTSDYGISGLDSWHLTEARAISADGRTIVGSGINPSGQTEAWVATVPEPSSSLFLLFSSLFLLRRRLLHAHERSVME